VDSVIQLLNNWGLNEKVHTAPFLSNRQRSITVAMIAEARSLICFF